MTPAALLLASAVFFGGCAATNYDTSYRVTVSATPVAATEAWPSAPESRAGLVEDSDRFKDERLSAQWHLWDWNIKLKLQNRTGLVLKVLWPDARIAWDGETDVLQNKDQRVAAPTVLPPGDSATYHVYPLSLLQWISWGDPAAGRGHWSNMGASAPVFGLSFMPDQSPQVRQERAKRAVGHHVNILLPVEAGGERLSYLFRLDIKDARNYGVRY